MDFLIEIFNPDVFSIIHKYTGQIIEDAKFYEKTAVFLLPKRERENIESTLKISYYIDSPIIKIKLTKIYTVKIDNVLHKIFNINAGALISIFISEDLDFIYPDKVTDELREWYENNVDKFYFGSSDFERDWGGVPY